MDRQLIFSIGAVMTIGALVYLFLPDMKEPPQHVQQQTCLPFSSSQLNRCVITEKAVDLTTEEKTYAGEFEFCYLKPDHGSLDIQQIGVNTFRFRSTGGAFPIQYKMIKRESLIDGKCPGKF